MLDIAEQIERYAEHAAAMVEPVRVTEVIDVRVSAPVPIVPGAGASPARTRLQVRQLVMAVLVVVLGTTGAVALARRGDSPAQVSASSSTSTSTSPVTTDAFGLTTGHHGLDPGPLTPRQGASVTWTGREVIVLGGERQGDGAAYDPASRTWRPLPPSPLPPGVVVAAWTGTEVVAVSKFAPGGDRGTKNSDGGERAAGAYDPGTNAWRRLANAPAPTASLSGLLVTDDHLFLADALASYDPRTDTWAPLGMDTTLLAGANLAASWTGDTLVFAGMGAPTIRYTPRTGQTVRDAMPPDHGRNQIATQVVAQPIGELVVLLDQDGRAARFDPRTGTWTPEGTPTLNPLDCTPRGFVLNDLRSVWDLCSAHWMRTANGEWHALDNGYTCCQTASASTGTVLFSWTSNDDTVNDPTAPYRAFTAWVPPTAPSDTTTYTTNGVSITVPARWQVATQPLMPHLGDPARPWERLSIGTGPLPPNGSNSRCAQFPVAAIEALGATDIVISVTEPTDGRDLGPRPPQQPPAAATDESETCVDRTVPYQHWSQGLSVNGRPFYVFVAMGTDVSPSDKAATWAAVNSLNAT